MCFEEIELEEQQNSSLSDQKGNRRGVLADVSRSNVVIRCQIYPMDVSTGKRPFRVHYLGKNWGGFVSGGNDDSSFPIMSICRSSK